MLTDTPSPYRLSWGACETWLRKESHRRVEGGGGRRRAKRALGRTGAGCRCSRDDAESTELWAEGEGVLKWWRGRREEGEGGGEGQESLLPKMTSGPLKSTGNKEMLAINRLSYWEWRDVAK
jgi:hypothetical protein